LEVTLILIGAGISFCSSVGILLLTRFIQQSGKVKVYSKIVYNKILSNMTWGFRVNEQSGKMFFDIPVWIEILNTTDKTQVIRDFHMLLCQDGKALKKMTQINRVNEEVISNNGAYSFVLPPRSIQKFECYFSIERTELHGNEKFDEVKASYFNCKDKQCFFHFKDVDNCWEISSNKIDGDWILLKK